MAETVALHPAQSLLARETRVTPGPVPVALDGVEVRNGHHRMTRDAFLLRSDTGLAFLYRRGHGVTVHRAPGADLSEEALWLNGSVYAAVASLNGLMPIHASAVACGGRVFACTGPSGAGKSTLAAALGRHGLPLFADDTLVLDLSDPAQVWCLPGHKRLKLTDQALDLTGAAAQERVGVHVPKHYARPAAGEVRDVLPLADLLLIEEGPGPLIEPVSGAQRILALEDDHYTAEYFAQARSLDRPARFALLGRIAPLFAMHRFSRPRDADLFARGAALVAAHIKGVSP